MASAFPFSQTSDNTRIISLNNRIWRVKQADERLVQTFIQQHNLEPLVAQILAIRAMPLEKIAGYLQPKLRDYLPDPFSFKDMDKAAERIASAIENKEKIALFGDYDVDGATSTALMARFLRFYGLDPTLHIPDRLLEGYGPNVKAFQKFIDDGHSLIITLDCGVVAFDPLQHAADKGIDVVVLDHHMAAPTLPPAVAVVNPNRLDNKKDYTYLAAVGVTFMTLVAISQLLKNKNIDTPDLMESLDLVALGTVCDVVPLIDLNRAFVTQGLKIMSHRKNPGLSALADVAGMNQKPNAYHAGFVFGPRINAGGRIASSKLGVDLLCSSCPHETLTIAQELDDHNRERQAMEKTCVEEALGMVARDESRHSHMILLASPEWHPGVIGLIAARLKERYQRPACVIALGEGGKGKASGRSITGIDLGALVIKARLQGLIHEGGGHAMAAGFSVHKDQIDALHQFFHQELLGMFGPELPVPEIHVDGIIAPHAVQLPVVRQLSQLEPFGAGNPAPKLMLSPVRLQRIDLVKEKHLRLQVTDLSGQQRLGIMMFGQANLPLHKALSTISPHQKIAILGSLKLNAWQGREEAQFIADDIALLE